MDKKELYKEKQQELLGLLKPLMDRYYMNDVKFVVHQDDKPIASVAYSVDMRWITNGFLNTTTPLEDLDRLAFYIAQENPSSGPYCVTVETYDRFKGCDLSNGFVFTVTHPMNANGIVSQYDLMKTTGDNQFSGYGLFALKTALYLQGNGWDKIEISVMCKGSEREVIRHNNMFVPTNLQKAVQGWVGSGPQRWSQNTTRSQNKALQAAGDLCKNKEAICLSNLLHYGDRSRDAMATFLTDVCKNAGVDHSTDIFTVFGPAGVWLLNENNYMCNHNNFLLGAMFWMCFVQN